MFTIITIVFCSFLSQVEIYDQNQTLVEEYQLDSVGELLDKYNAWIENISRSPQTEESIKENQKLEQDWYILFRQAYEKHPDSHFYYRLLHRCLAGANGIEAYDESLYYVSELIRRAPSQSDRISAYYQGGLIGSKLYKKTHLLSDAIKAKEYFQAVTKETLDDSGNITNMESSAQCVDSLANLGELELLAKDNYSGAADYFAQAATLYDKCSPISQQVLDSSRSPEYLWNMTAWTAAESGRIELARKSMSKLQEVQLKTSIAMYYASIISSAKPKILSEVLEYAESWISLHPHEKDIVLLLSCMGNVSKANNLDSHEQRYYQLIIDNYSEELLKTENGEEQLQTIQQRLQNRSKD